MTHEASHQSEGTGKSHAWIYWALGLVFLVLLIVALFTYSSDREDQQAQQKADQLIEAFEAAGLPTPENSDVFTTAFGNDGGAMCDDPASALKKALFDVNLANGAATVGIRPIKADARVVQGELIALNIYCPEQLPDFEKFIQDKEYDDVIKD